MNIYLAWLSQEDKRVTYQNEKDHDALQQDIPLIPLNHTGLHNSGNSLCVVFSAPEHIKNGDAVSRLQVTANYGLISQT